MVASSSASRLLAGARGHPDLDGNYCVTGVARHVQELRYNH